VRLDPADVLMVEDDPGDALIAAVGRLARCGAVRYMCGYDLHAGVCRHLQCHCWRRWSGGGDRGSGSFTGGEPVFATATRSAPPTSHCPRSSTAFLDAGLTIERFTEGGEPTPTVLAVRARKSG